jgi:hypothetical protein
LTISDESHGNTAAWSQYGDEAGKLLSNRVKSMVAGGKEGMWMNKQMRHG